MVGDKRYDENVPKILLEFTISCGLEITSQSTHLSSLPASEHGARLLYAVARGGSVRLAGFLLGRGVSLCTGEP